MYNNVQKHLEISSLKKVSPKYSPFYSFPKKIWRTVTQQLLEYAETIFSGADIIKLDV